MLTSTVLQGRIHQIEYAMEAVKQVLPDSVTIFSSSHAPPLHFSFLHPPPPSISVETVKIGFCVTIIIFYKQPLLFPLHFCTIFILPPPPLHFSHIPFPSSHPPQGSVTVGIKSKTHVVLVALKRSSNELSSYQKKIYPIDDHVAVSIAGLTSDGRMLG